MSRAGLILALVCALSLGSGAYGHRWFKATVDDGVTTAEWYSFYHSSNGFWELNVTGAEEVTGISLAQITAGMITTVVDLLPTALEPVTNPISGDADIYGIFHPSSLTAAYSAWNLTNVQNGLADGSIVFVLTSGEENTETTGEVEELEGPAEEPSDDPSAATIVEWWFTAPKKGTSSDSPPPAQPLSALAESRRRVEKLRGYHDLAQDAVDRAQRQDASGATQAATRLWTAAQSILAAAPPPLRSAVSQPSGAADKEERAYEDRILTEVLDDSPAVGWDDVAGLAKAKQALQEMVVLPTLRRDLFQGLRAPARGLLLYGPPGNGKTLLAKALAHEAQATFFNISAASLTSKWHGEAEKLVRALFRVAAAAAPSIIFIDEIDSVLSARRGDEHDASRRLKTEFLSAFDGVASGAAHLLVLGATNRPWDLDEAVVRRLPKRIYVALPGAEGRRALLEGMLRGQRADPGIPAVVAGLTEGYSGSDLAALCKEAAMAPIRELGRRVATVPANRIRGLTVADFRAGLQVIRPSLTPESMAQFEEWTARYGTAT
ncbi:Spastin [Auxenochlorella protothecoides]|uniref:microtubule-severing ATPase n=2 Tax=Auxenochlorella protothecoides TaxID=3075 RepID=A0A087S9I6_AUXPR|nr:Spastin [Auxenochlorella protothecoides]KFM22390.1 Spastin [Auxenochlorella protothecoides]